MIKTILIRYGDLMLKGFNRRRFIKRTNSLIKEKVDLKGIRFESSHDRFYVHIEDDRVDPNTIIAKLKTVSGLSSFSPVAHARRTIESMRDIGIELLKHKTNTPQSFKLIVKRSDKTFPIESMDVAKTISSDILKHYPNLSVNLSHPDLTLTIEIRKRGVYVYTDKIQGMGGFPVGVAGKGLLMLSGGIDSPVAGYLAMKQGVEIEAIHFESTPLTSIESAQKVIDLVKKLSVYAPDSTIKLHMIPFKAMHTKLLEFVPDPYQITIMRRMMYRIAERMALMYHTPSIINGESIGQVASQTLESMKVVNDVTPRPIIRPLITTDKQTITKLAKTIDCYDISIRPFEDCCTVYTPKKPATAPRVYYAKRYEGLFNYRTMIDDLMPLIRTISIHKNTTLDLTKHGLTVEEALEEAGVSYDYEFTKQSN
ncbi:MAG: tRNA uracil 4-sulfurtransferase ThiI [Bacillota bacterium]